MKGLEGSADLDGDGDIEAGELHEYARTNVSRHATRLGRQQTPTIEGDTARVLVQLTGS
jgi:hypothetical protein